jgi:hypothetical protein
MRRKRGQASPGIYRPGRAASSTGNDATTIVENELPAGGGVTVKLQRVLQLSSYLLVQVDFT